MTLNLESIKDNSKSQNLVEKKPGNVETEKINESIWLDKISFKIALMSTFTALAVVFGYMLAYVPNIEIFTLTIFLSGFILGNQWKTVWLGMIVGLLSSIIFTFFNPLGASPPLLYLYQVFHYSCTGLSGGLVRQFLNGKKYFKPEEDLYNYRVIVLFGLVGGIITFIFDILSTLFGGFVVSVTIDYFIATYLLGIVFTTIHLIGNVLIFVFILPGMIQVITKLIG
jgi:hypothetical protein